MFVGFSFYLPIPPFRLSSLTTVIHVPISSVVHVHAPAISGVLPCYVQGSIIGSIVTVSRIVAVCGRPLTVVAEISVIDPVVAEIRVVAEIPVINMDTAVVPLLGVIVAVGCCNSIILSVITVVGIGVDPVIRVV